MTLGSLFDGSGGFPLAGQLNGIKTLWSSEIEPYPLRVTAARFPNVKQLGDIRNINGAEIEPVDIITFGSPCQDLSIAGAQKGIHGGTRSSLFFEAIRVIREMREYGKQSGRTAFDIRPKYAVWENVCGAFNSNGGKDFQAVLQAFSDICEDGVDIIRPSGGRGGLPGAWSVMGGRSLGKYTTQNVMYRNVEKGYTLSQVLETKVPKRYYLTARAAMGIIRRSEQRGKILPKMLKEALEEIISEH